jgi:hypothetical protein
VQWTGASAVLLVGGSLAPWARYSGPNFSADYTSGVQFNAGMLALVAGSVAIGLLAMSATRHRALDTGGVAALGLLACGLVAITGIRYHGDEYSLMWGFWVSAGAAAALLVVGLIPLGLSRAVPPTPD